AAAETPRGVIGVESRGGIAAEWTGAPAARARSLIEHLRRVRAAANARALLYVRRLLIRLPHLRAQDASELCGDVLGQAALDFLDQRIDAVDLGFRQVHASGQKLRLILQRLLLILELCDLRFGLLLRRIGGISLGLGRFDLNLQLLVDPAGNRLRKRHALLRIVENIRVLLERAWPSGEIVLDARLPLVL